MDWTSIILALLGGTSVAGIIEAIRYRRENKRLKENEVKVSDVDAQRQQIELADLYKDKVLEMLDQLTEKQDKGNTNQDKILEKLDDLNERLLNVETYLNGNYKSWLEGHKD